MKSRIGVIVALLLLLPLGLALAQTKGDPKAGKAKYDANCITDGKTMNALTDKYLFDIIKQGGKAVQKAAIMPAANKKLVDQDISDMVAYIRSLANPPYKPAAK